MIVIQPEVNNTSKDDRIKLFNDFMSHHDLSVVGKFILSPLNDLGYFEAPASASHHGAYKGGLFDHSLEVAKQLVHLTECNNLKWCCRKHNQSPVLIGLFHDLCKVDLYVEQLKSVPATLDDITYCGQSKAQSVSVFAGYTKQPTSIWGKGHGVKSCMIASSIFNLSEEDLLCIRYHMGAYEKDDWDSLDKAIAKYPNVLWTHIADMVASKIVGV